VRQRIVLATSLLTFTVAERRTSSPPQFVAAKQLGELQDLGVMQDRVYKTAIISINCRLIKQNLNFSNIQNVLKYWTKSYYFSSWNTQS